MGSELLVAVEVGLSCYGDAFVCRKQRSNFSDHFLLSLWFEREMIGTAVLFLWKLLHLFCFGLLSIAVSENTTQ